MQVEILVDAVKIVAATGSADTDHEELWRG
jgi:hypothetical protein